MQGLLVEVHLFLWVAIGALLLVLLTGMLPAAIRGLQPPSTYVPLRRAVGALVGGQVVVGALLLAFGRRPGSILHLVYAAVALAILPGARALARRSPGNARWYQVGGMLLLAGVVFRLWTTG